MTEFTTLGLAASILETLDAVGYTTPTPIQKSAIPPIIAGSDLLGIAQTGTGKTAAFALPILHRLMANPRPRPRKGCRVLILSPTRELASQIAESFRTYGRAMDLAVAVVFGGVGHRPQVQAMLRGVDVLVATPGRLLDHISDRAIDLRSTEIFVLDEADQMLDLGFVKPIRQVVAQLPSRRQNLFFSATMPKEIAGLADDLLRDPVKVAVTPVASTVERIEQHVIHVEHNRKRALLIELLRKGPAERTLIFTRTKRGADRVVEHLDRAEIDAASIHGNKSQRQREAALAAFRAGKVLVLVATDIAARGIDVDGVSHVINFDLPEVPEAYVHRIGRTARAGASGTAISLCAPDDRDLLRGIERLTRQTIPAMDRRNDASLESDKSSGSVRRADSRPGQSQEHRSNGRGQGKRNGDRDRPGAHRARPDDGRGSGERQPGAGHRGGPGAQGKPQKPNRIASDRARQPADVPADIGGVAFLSAPIRRSDDEQNRRPRSAGDDRSHPNRGNAGHKKPHRRNRDRNGKSAGGRSPIQGGEKRAGSTGNRG